MDECTTCNKRGVETTSISCDESLCSSCYAKLPKKETILEEAARLVNGPRRAEYGHPQDNFSDIAKLWRVLLRDERITAENVVQCMIAFKLCRAKQGYTRDTAVDIAGYAQCWELVNE
jgi:hypothetical protein